ncbi:MAG: ankyrin repeat domain-containing protein [Candidatus Babeliaceae bacterium]|nr:ankyrin repeat domain-containing protein [Candidatus Babeliaceae bacterium]
MFLKLFTLGMCLPLLLFSAPKVESNKKLPHSIVGMLRKREQGNRLTSAVKKKIEMLYCKAKYHDYFMNIFVNQHVDVCKKTQNLADFIKKEPECIDGFLALLEDAVPQEHVAYKTDLFSLIISNKGTLPYQSVLRKIIESDGFDVNAFYNVKVSGDETLCFEKTFLHHAAQHQDIPLMQLLAEYNADRTLKMHGLTPLVYYRLHAEICDPKKFPADPITHKEIIKLLTP